MTGFAFLDPRTSAMDDAVRRGVHTPPDFRRLPASVTRSVIAAGGLAVVPAPNPLPDGWTPGLAAIAVAVLALLAIGTALLQLRPAGRRRSGRVRHQGRPSFRRPGDTLAPVHLISAAEGPHAIQGVIESVREFMFRGERVLMIDAGRRIGLHEAFGRDARWGFGECLQGTLPLLGVIQETGYSGLYLLARGSTGAETWSALGRLLDDAAPHFARVILAVDPGCPHVAGDALRGRVVEGWWAGSVPVPRAGQALAERIGIKFHGLTLRSTIEDAIEALLDLPTPPAPLPRAVIAEQLPPGVRLLPKAPPEPAAPPLPDVVDWNLAVGERLRFLAWARRLNESTSGAV
jgi:hypothetical protein